MSDNLFDDPEVCQAVLMDYYRNPRCAGVCQDATHAAEGRNPACGDIVKLSFRMEAGRIQEARTTGAGCAVSQASASLLMERLQGATIEEASAILKSVDRLLTRCEVSGDADRLGHLAALRFILSNPARIRCAQVARDAALAALSPPG